jgi:hyperosmotically inducible protein
VHQKLTRGLSGLAVATLFAATLTVAFPQGPAEKAPAPDNTKINKRDRNKAEPTADQQKENQADRDIASQIRKAIMDDKSLSTYARNVKIIAQEGTVTLRGPVRSSKEKEIIESKATQVAGKDHVVSQLEIKPEN